MFHYLSEEEVLRKKAERPKPSFVTVPNYIKEDADKKVFLGKYGMDDADDCVSSNKKILEEVTKKDLIIAIAAAYPSWTEDNYGEEFEWSCQVRPYYAYKDKIILAQYLLDVEIMKTESGDFLITLSTPVYIMDQKYTCLVKKENSRDVELFIDCLKQGVTSCEIGIECPYGDMNFDTCRVYNVDSEYGHPPLKIINFVFFDIDIEKNRCDEDSECKEKNAWRNFVYINKKDTTEVVIETGYFIPGIYRLEDDAMAHSRLGITELGVMRRLNIRIMKVSINRLFEQVSEELAKLELKLEAREKFEQDFESLENMKRNAEEDLPKEDQLIQELRQQYTDFLKGVPKEKEMFELLKEFKEKCPEGFKGVEVLSEYLKDSKPLEKPSFVKHAAADVIPQNIQFNDDNLGRSEENENDKLLENLDRAINKGYNDSKVMVDDFGDRCAKEVQQAAELISAAKESCFEEIMTKQNQRNSDHQDSLAEIKEGAGKSVVGQHDVVNKHLDGIKLDFSDYRSVEEVEEQRQKEQNDHKIKIDEYIKELAKVNDGACGFDGQPPYQEGFEPSAAVSGEEILENGEKVHKNKVELPRIDERVQDGGNLGVKYNKPVLFDRNLCKDQDFSNRAASRIAKAVEKQRIEELEKLIDGQDNDHKENIAALEEKLARARDEEQRFAQLKAEAGKGQLQKGSMDNLEDDRGDNKALLSELGIDVPNTLEECEDVINVSRDEYQMKMAWCIEELAKLDEVVYGSDEQPKQEGSKAAANMGAGNLLVINDKSPEELVRSKIKEQLDQDSDKPKCKPKGLKGKREKREGEAKWDGILNDLKQIRTSLSETSGTLVASDEKLSQKGSKSSCALVDEEVGNISNEDLENIANMAALDAQDERDQQIDKLLRKIHKRKEEFAAGVDKSQPKQDQEEGVKNFGKDESAAGVDKPQPQQDSEDGVKNFGRIAIGFDRSKEFEESKKRYACFHDNLNSFFANHFGSARDALLGESLTSATSDQTLDQGSSEKTSANDNFFHKSDFDLD